MQEEFDINTVHDELLVLLKEFDRICKTNNINYSLHGGTLLGAIREHGFIPWDDDADIVLIRSEFDKLTSCLSKMDLEDGYTYIKTGHSNKLLLKRPNKPLVCVDIIVCDYISSNSFIQKFKFAGLSFFKIFTRDVSSLKITKARGKYTGYKFLIICFICLLGMYFPKYLKEKMSDSFMTKFKGDGKCLHRSNDQYIGMIKIMPNYIMDEYQYVDFEDTKLQVSKYFHEILVNCYGDDYMIPKKDFMANHSLATKCLGKNLLSL